MSATPGRARRSTIRVALGLAITGLVAIFSGGMVVLSAGPAVSVPGSSPADPIVVANPADVPVGAVEDGPSTYGTPSECDTTRSWVFVVPGTDAVTHQEWTAELRTRSIYRNLLMRGLAPDEAANITAFLAGIPIGDARWTLRQINELLFLREMNRTGHFTEPIETRIH